MLIPIFPLKVVLFPGGSLQLRVFERRYLDMVSSCLRENAPFGVCLIRSGQEVGLAADPFPIGTLGVINDWEQRPDGLLGITVQGQSRFVLERQHVGEHQLLMGEVRLLEAPAACLLPEEFAPLAGLLRRILEQLRGPYQNLIPNYEDADWVGYRLAEILPLPLGFKQELLELMDPFKRLALLQTNLGAQSSEA